MFWRKKTAVPESNTALYALAAELGVEKRFSPRVHYPPRVTAGLPRFVYGERTFRAHDVSVGGCSLLDPNEVFGAEIGLEFKLTVDWGDEQDLVSARLVGRVDRRRNFQFLDLPTIRAERIRNVIAPGVRGSTLNVIRESGAAGPVLDAIEMWTSPGGDSVTIESHLQRVATIYLAGKSIVVLRAASPQDDQGRPISAIELDALILFLANVPKRSSALTQLLTLLEQTCLEAER